MPVNMYWAFGVDIDSCTALVTRSAIVTDNVPMCRVVSVGMMACGRGAVLRSFLADFDAFFWLRLIGTCTFAHETQFARCEPLHICVTLLVWGCSHQSNVGESEKHICYSLDRPKDV